MKCIVALSALITGCASVNAPAVFTDPFSVKISVREGLMLNSSQMAYSRLLIDADGKIAQCDVVLRKYPVCLLHELRHCIEGDWHPRDEPNTEDC